MKIQIKKRIGKRYPYYYANKCPLQYGEWKYIRTFYLLCFVIVIKVIKNK